MSPRPFLRFIVGLNLTVIGFSIGLGLFKTGNPSRYFGEGRFTTFFSAAQLVTIGIFSGLTFAQRNRRPDSGAELAPFPRKPHYIWLLMAAGFVFLATDEIFEIHERMDRWIVVGLGLARTPLTSRLDDVIMAVYGVTGLGMMWLCRRELLKFRQVMRGPMMAGFACLFLGLLCDTAAHDDHFFHWLTGDLPLAKKLNGWFSALEGAFTLLPEGLFIAAFRAAWKQSLTPGGGNSDVGIES